MLWLSAQQIADAAQAGLMPGMPTSARGVNRIASNEGWAETSCARKREGARGGGLEYHIDLLPVGARSAWIAHNVGLTSADFRPELSDEALSLQNEARIVLIKTTDKLKQALGCSQSAADAYFEALFNNGHFPLPEWIKKEVKSLSARTLARWRKAIREGGKVGATGRPKGSGILDRAEGGDVRSLILAAISKQPFLKAKHVRALIWDCFGDELNVVDPATGEISSAPLPSIRMFQIALKEWREEYKNEILRITDPDGYRNKVEFTATNSQTATRLNEVWQIDASPADVMLNGKRRHSIYMAVDVYSRRAIVLATPTPRAEGVGLLIRRCILAWGVPERIKTDNGSDFVARQIKRLFAALGIEVELSPPYQPKSKGIVERTIGTFQRDLATCPGFIGHSVADRKVIEGRKSFNQRLGAKAEDLFEVEMDLPAFQEWCDAWGQSIYGNDQHTSLQNRSPNLVAATYAGPVHRIENVAALDVLLAPIASGNGIRQVTKQGIRVDGSRYLPLGGAMPGDSVFVRMDPADMGRVMMFSPETDEFLGEAICPDLAGMSPQEITAKAKAMQKAYEDDRLKDIRRHKRRLKSSNVADALRREGESKAQEVIAFPSRNKEYTTPSIDAAAEAAKSAPERPTEAPKEDRIAKRQAALITKLKVPSKPSRSKEPPAHRYRRALVLEEAMSAGETIDPADQAWLETYQSLPEYRAQKKMYEIFGDKMFAG